MKEKKKISEITSGRKYRNTIKVGTNLPPELIIALDQYVVKHNLPSRSWALELAIKKFLAEENNENF